MVLLEVKDVHFSYDGKPVLKGVSLQVSGGEILGLIGPNGAGKSTLIKLIAGILAPQEGAIEILGRPLKSWRRQDLAKVVALVPQGAYIPPTFTVWESVLLGRTPYLRFPGIASKKDIEAVQRAMEWAEVGHLQDKFVGELSGGERQRVILARALAQEPKVLLLDEPTAHLDIHHQVSTLRLIQGLARAEGLAVLAVLHDLNLASSFSDRIALLVEGRVLAQGSPEEVIVADRLHRAYGSGILVMSRPDNSTRPIVLPDLRIS
jgi:iron complex transport system ATP-binding protein